MPYLDTAETPDAMVALIGSHARDSTTGIAGRIVAVCFNEGDATQLQLRRYGVDGNGHPYPMHWVHLDLCCPATRDEAKHD